VRCEWLEGKSDPSPAKRRGFGITEKVWLGWGIRRHQRMHVAAQNLNATLETQASGSSKGDASEREQNGSGV
jgi:hypothetical protein